MHIASNEARVASIATLRLVTMALRFVTTAIRFNPFPLRDFPYLVLLAGAEKITLRLTRAEKVIFLLLCVAEQYRGAVELCETEGLE